MIQYRSPIRSRKASKATGHDRQGWGANKTRLEGGLGSVYGSFRRVRVATEGIGGGGGYFDWLPLAGPSGVSEWRPRDGQAAARTLMGGNWFWFLFLCFKDGLV